MRPSWRFFLSISQATDCSPLRPARRAMFFINEFFAQPSVVATAIIK
jgi:hypothetical protein